MKSDFPENVVLSFLRGGLKAAGIETGVRNKTVAEKTGYSEKTVANILSGNSKLTPRFITAVCTAFGISKEWVLGGGKGPMLLFDPQQIKDVEQLASSATDYIQKQISLTAEITEGLRGLTSEELQNVKWFVGLMRDMHVLQDTVAYMEHKEEDKLQNKVDFSERENTKTEIELRNMASERGITLGTPTPRRHRLEDPETEEGA